MSEIQIEKGGRLTLPAEAVKNVGGQPLRVSASSPHHVLLESATGNDKILMTGQLDTGGIVDLLSFFNMFRKSGVLHFLLSGGINASHNHPIRIEKRTAKTIQPA